ncbi:hypothetical protein EVAR_52564_1 [Eumeta japonica]|uniref:Uncharacterized protein n=1 Tax=Eumeta variegata TaxID=151549 RepID=A0A4C1YFB5_EUMVA|nr:hypothetical protein EVAR_52564_1 [Eumeta japonica]
MKKLFAPVFVRIGTVAGSRIRIGNGNANGIKNGIRIESKAGLRLRLTSINTKDVEINSMPMLAELQTSTTWLSHPQERAGQRLSGQLWSPLPMDTCNPREITSASLVSWVRIGCRRIGYSMERALTEGDGRALVMRTLTPWINYSHGKLSYSYGKLENAQQPRLSGTVNDEPATGFGPASKGESPNGFQFENKETMVRVYHSSAHVVGEYTCARGVPRGGTARPGAAGRGAKRQSNLAQTSPPAADKNRLFPLEGLN